VESWAVPKGISIDTKVKRLAVIYENRSLGLLFPDASVSANLVVIGSRDYLIT